VNDRKESSQLPLLTDAMKSQITLTINFSNEEVNSAVLPATVGE
jgi:hypothetical protein